MGAFRVVGKAGDWTAAAVDDEAVLVERKLAVARIADRGVMGDPERPVAVDRHVHRIAGGRDVALSELGADRRQARADADLGPGATSHRCPEYVGEFGPSLLEADGGSVGDVVADRVEVFRCGVQARQGLFETHVVLPFKSMPSRYCICAIELKPTYEPLDSRNCKVPSDWGSTPTTCGALELFARTL